MFTTFANAAVDEVCLHRLLSAEERTTSLNCDVCSLALLLRWRWRARFSPRDSNSVDVRAVAVTTRIFWASLSRGPWWTTCTSTRARTQLLVG